MQLRLILRHLIAAVFLLSVMMGCTDSRHSRKPARLSDAHYTQQQALDIYAYNPQRALHIIDSALIAGNINELQADLNRACIFSKTQMGEQLDSLMGWIGSERLDTARIIGERLLQHESVKEMPALRQDVLEMLAYTARMQQDTTRWLMRSRQLVEVCREQGAETEALRAEAEIGAALCYLGLRVEGMEKLDSVIARLDNKESRHFNELDAKIIAMKRKIGVLAACGQYVETIPIARCIIERLDDYELHPDIYHDGSYREPQDSTKRADYIQFYRNQAQSFITAAYSSLGEHGNMENTYQLIERSVRESIAREHIARYQTLEQEMRMLEAESRCHMLMLVTISTAIGLLLILLFATYTHSQKQQILQKNRALVHQINESVKYKEKYEEILQNLPQKQHHLAGDTCLPEEARNESLSSLSDDELFAYLSDVIAREHLYLDSTFCRQKLIDHFPLSKERIGNAFSHGSNYASMSAFIRELRLKHAFHLLTDNPTLPIEQVANASGYAITDTFTRNFKSKYGITPSEFRLASARTNES